MTVAPSNGRLFLVAGHLAQRYADALRHISGKSCSLDRFSVDLMGWSPEVAEQLGDEYLGPEGIRQAIILSPDQAGAPLLRPKFSYEGALLKRVYETARPTLLSLVEQEPVIVELDNGLSTCRNAGDLVAIKQVTAHITTPKGTLRKTAELLNMAQGLQQQSRLLDDRYIERMLALVRDVGDPRRTPLPPVTTLPITSLWAELNGVVYILRSTQAQGRQAIVVATKPDASLSSMPVASVAIDDPQLVDILHAAGFLRYLLSEEALHKRLWELEREALLEVGVEEIQDDYQQTRRAIARSTGAQAALPQLYWELDAAIKRLHAGGRIDQAGLSPEARWALSAPADEHAIVVNLLARFVPYDYRMLVYHHRRRVEAEWSRYSEAKRRYLAGMFPYLATSTKQPAEA